jgi:predicted dehydrogenase
MNKTWKVVGIDFDHMHMGDNLWMVHHHPNAEIVGIYDTRQDRLDKAASEFGLGSEKVFTDFRACMEKTQPDIVILCSATARHGDWVEQLAPYGAHLLVEKPFAATLAEADRMAAAVQPGQRLAINWPLAWYPSHRTAKRLLDEGTIGDLLNVHYYSGNRGPLWHLAHKEETTPEWVAAEKPKSWFYQRAEGGGSMLDYLGYGTTLGTWYQGGRKPIEVTAVVDEPAGLEVDEHSITVARYAHGLSKFETRWGTFTDPWTHQPQPKCGFILCGTQGTIASYDKTGAVRMQTRQHPEGIDVPVDPLDAPHQNPVQYLIHCIEHDLPIEGPLSIETSRIGQQIVDTAFQSAQEKRTLPLLS